MTTAGALDRGRESFERQAWSDACTQLTAADGETALGPDDLERLAIACYLIGRDDEAFARWERAHHASLGRGDDVRAARCARWLALGLLFRGELARVSGWVARAHRLLDEGGVDCAERGFLIELQGIGEADAATAYATSTRAVEIGERFGDRDVTAYSRLGQAEALLRLGRTAEAVSLLDEVMVSVTAGEVSPIVAGIVYCAVIEICRATFDLRRAREWTAALTNWCESQADLVPYRGQCLVHRSEIMLLHGAWPDAVEAAELAYERFRTNEHPATGAARYQQGELHRLRGEFAAAEDAYRQASRWGREPQPGLALLRLAQGQVTAAAAALRRLLDEAQEPAVRPTLLPAYVEVMLGAADGAAARAAADELSAIAADHPAPMLRAVARQATGAVLLAEGDARAAVTALRSAWMDWQTLDAPYEAARVRVLLGLACGQLGDTDSAAMEFDAARWVFERLGAAHDCARVEALSRPSGGRTRGGLTAREREVLALVAAGKSNRAIAADLFLSEHTVARHVQNILGKLGVASRTAATAHAVEHRLI
jgi:ATP/maltotriose-dependent transcriptional regulator MalT